MKHSMNPNSYSRSTSNSKPSAPSSQGGSFCWGVASALVLLSQAALASSPSAPAYAGKYEGTTDQQMPCRVSVPQGLDGEIKISYRPAQGPWEACSFNPKERSVSRTTVKAAARIDGVVCKVRLNLGKDGKPDTADLMTGGILGLGYDVTCRDLKQAQE